MYLSYLFGEVRGCSGGVHDWRDVMAGGGFANSHKPTRRRQPAGVDALRVLEMLVDYPEGVGTTDLADSLGMDADSLGMHIAQAHRLLNGLRSADYVAHTETSPVGTSSHRSYWGWRHVMSTERTYPA